MGALKSRGQLSSAATREPDFILMDVYLDEGRQAETRPVASRSMGYTSFVDYRVQRLGDVACIHDLLPGSPWCLNQCVLLPNEASP